ncbi:MAG: hypothetical protein EXS37_08500 [Opitutus sp.]|nr:hypothetical protein [Opitutus sp.]
MKTTTIALTAALLVSGAPIFAQPTAGPGQPSEQHGAEPSRRPSPKMAPMGPDARRPMQPQPGAGRPGEHQRPGQDPMAENFFPPDLIMHHQQALALSEEQRKRIIEATQKGQTQATELQWQMQVEQSAFMALLRADRPDEKQVIAQAEKVHRIEGEMRRGQLVMLVRVKNELTAQQQAELREIMRRPGQTQPR